MLINAYRTLLCMEFPIEKKKRSHSFSQGTYDLAYQFAKIAYPEFKQFLKGIILFGSAARKTDDVNSDIDILILVDDVSISLTKEIMETYKIITQKIISQVSNRIHVTTMKFTTFFEYMRNNDPVVINILRDGVALIDTGFFDPMQELLYAGKIRPTFESAWVYHNRAKNTLHNSQWHMLRACEDLYWAVSDSAQAGLMKQGIVPPSPEHLSSLVYSHLVAKRILSSKQEKTVQLMYDLYKKITHKQVKSITASQFEHYSALAHSFVNEIDRFLKL